MTLARVIRGRVRACAQDERGFSLPELLVAIVAGVIVLMASWTVLDGSVQNATTVSDRTDASQRGRIAMEQMIRQLRAQVCPPSSDPMKAYEPMIELAQADAVIFYADVGGEQYRPDRRQFAYSAGSGGGPGSITETVWAAAGTEPSFTWPSQATRTRVIATDVERVEDQSGTELPIFRYYAFDTTASPVTPTLELTSPPLSEADRQRVVKVKVSFVSRAGRGGEDPGVPSTFEADAFVRSADASEPGKGPQCG